MTHVYYIAGSSVERFNQCNSVVDTIALVFASLNSAIHESQQTTVHISNDGRRHSNSGRV